MPEIKVSFNPPLDRVGRAFGKIQIGKSLQEGIAKFGFSIEARAKEMTPVRTGRLRASIGTSIGNLEARIAPHVEYAGFVHEGTFKMRPRPFMLWGLSAAAREFDEGDLARRIDQEISAKLKGV